MLKSGTNVYSNGLRFEYIVRATPWVKVYSTEQTHNTIAKIQVGHLTNKQELEELVAWWIFDNELNLLG